jgi:hypothetical protein
MNIFTINKLSWLCFICKESDIIIISHNNCSRTDIPLPSLNYIKNQLEKYIKGIKGNNGFNNKIGSNKKINENNKDINIIVMSKIEDFDKPKEKK